MGEYTQYDLCRFVTQSSIHFEFFKLILKASQQQIAILLKQLHPL